MQSVENMPNYTSTFSLLLFFLTFLLNLVTLGNAFTDFLWSCGNTVKTPATIIQLEIMDSISVCIILPDFLPDSNSYSIASRFCAFCTLAHTMVAYPYIIFLLLHSTTTYVGQFGLAGPHMLSFLRLTSFKIPLKGNCFLSPRPPTQTNLAMCPNVVSYWNEQVCECLLKSGIGQ